MKELPYFRKIVLYLTPEQSRALDNKLSVFQPDPERWLIQQIEKVSK